MLTIEQIDNKKAEEKIYKDIKKLIIKIRNSKSKSRFIDLSNDLKKLCHLCDDMNLFDYEKVEDYVYRDLDNDLSVLKFINSYHQKLLNIIDSNDEFFYDFANLCNLFKDFYDMDAELTKKVNMNDAISYAKEFMHLYSDNLYNSFNELESNNHILYQEACDIDSLAGELCNVTNLNMPYMGISLYGTIDDASTIAHETAHFEQFKYMNYRQPKNDIYFYGEMYPHFIELVFNNWASSKNIYNKDLYLTFRRILANTKDELDSLYVELFASDRKEYADYIQSNINYSLSKAVALEYYEMYLKDREKAKYYVDEFIKNSYSMEQIEILDNFGLDKESILDGKVLKKYIRQYKN